MKIWPLLLLLGGCSTTSIEDMYLELAVCVDDDRDCTKIQKRVNEKEEYLIQREYNNKPRCPPKHVEYCESPRDRGCGKRHKSPDDQFYCIHRNSWGIFN